ncbi:hypothetical protein QOT17_015318 [Balamuthia mandrillaris]
MLDKKDKNLAPTPGIWSAFAAATTNSSASLPTTPLSSLLSSISKENIPLPSQNVLTRPPIFTSAISSSTSTSSAALLPAQANSNKPTVGLAAAVHAAKAKPAVNFAANFSNHTTSLEIKVKRSLFLWFSLSLLHRMELKLKEIQALNDIRGELEKQLEELQNKCKAQEAASAEEKEELMRRIHEAEDKVAALQSQENALHQQLAALESEKLRVEQELKSEREQREKEVMEVNSVRKRKLKVYKQKLAEEVETNQELRLQNQLLQDEVKRLKAEMQEAHSNSNSLSSALSNMTAQLHDTERQFFLSHALALKLSLLSSSSSPTNCNLDIGELWEECQSENVPLQEWSSWLYSKFCPSSGK